VTCLTSVTGIVMILIILGQVRDIPTQLYRLRDLLTPALYAFTESIVISCHPEIAGAVVIVNTSSPHCFVLATALALGPDIRETRSLASKNGWR